MGVVLIVDKVVPQDIKIASEHYGDYIKVVADVLSGKVAIGGEWHADAEKILVNEGCKQEDIWGGGINMITKEIETLALINLRPRLNNDSQDILDPLIRRKFIEIVKEKFNL